ncbi:lysine N(6)-hydroxylase/L-ornithine N(5)-oxygenase family protein [Natrinema sp. H-ect4]|uniref:lysine N(6)-hydroxylase/L-ornithine N(5)-oxygenase family protein n=1 Tax=Natrinema sp. H-ect4 TaxID=3242699 RepID=UPI0035A934DB
MSKIYDVIGVGLGPFNLGFTALADGMDKDLDTLVLEQRSEFNWHEGILIEGTTLEVPFLADLVTMADPSSPYSYLNYLRKRDRLYEFYFYEEFFIPRREYNEYCRWVAENLSQIQFDRRVSAIRSNGDIFEVEARDPETGEKTVYPAQNVVMGIGSQPSVPKQLRGHSSEDVFHTASYLDHRERCLNADSITVVGSGQSAAEVFQNLLEKQSEHDYRLDWITRSRGFFQLIDAKLGHMIYTPEYTEYFYDLDQETKDTVLERQDLLYKGIDPQTSDEIYDLLYERSIGAGDLDIGMIPCTEIEDIEAVGHDDRPRYTLQCTQHQEGTSFTHQSDVIVLGTGYRRPEPTFLEPLEEKIDRDEKERLQVTKDFRLKTNGVPGEIFVQNAELHTHGINTPDLGLGCYRNATILNTLAGQEVYPAGRSSTFQDFKAEAFQRDPKQLIDTPSGGD